MVDQIEQPVFLSVADAELLEHAAVSFLRLACRRQALGCPLISEAEAQRLYSAVLQLQAQLVRCRQPGPPLAIAALSSSTGRS